VIFVSVPGKRGDATIAKREQDKTIKEAIKAVEAGATILTDNKAYTDASTYNTGEKRLYANMEAKGYNYSEITVDGQLIGTWSKYATQPTETTQAKVEEQEIEDNDFYSQEIKPVTNFYESLTDSEKEKLGNLADVIDSYEQLYADTMSVQEYIDNVLKCKL
jgi:hypothetical protein